MKVLIVDDALFMREMIKKMLVERGTKEIIEAEDGYQGIEQYKIHKPDIVLMDITMPELNGIDALKAIREYDAKAKVIIVSAMGQECKVREAVLNGAITFIVKPFEPEVLISAVEKVASM